MAHFFIGPFLMTLFLIRKILKYFILVNSYGFCDHMGGALFWDYFGIFSFDKSSMLKIPVLIIVMSHSSVPRLTGVGVISSQLEIKQTRQEITQGPR